MSPRGRTPKNQLDRAPTQQYSCLVIPNLSENGLLPAGIYRATWAEILKVYGTNSLRQRLLRGFYRVLLALKSAGCRTAYLDGSFVTAREAPGDFDGCWDVDGVDPLRLDPTLLKFEDRRLAQKLKYGGEMFPSQGIADSESGDTFLEFFQTDKETGVRKGILAVDLERMEP
jgi:hypothetical protein